MKMVVSDLADNITKAAFTPAKNAKPRLQQIGITNHHPALNFIPTVTPQEAKEITQYILGYRMKITQKVKDALAAGTLQVKVEKQKFKGPANWDNCFEITEQIKQALTAQQHKHDTKRKRPHDNNTNTNNTNDAQTGDLTGAIVNLWL